MDNVTEKATGVLKPFVLLAAYKSEGYSSNFYIESHEIGKNGEVYAGKPLSHDTVDEILKSFETAVRKEKAIPAGKIPSNLLYADSTKDKYAWIVPSKKRFLYFKDKLIGDGEAYVPEMLFVAKGNGLAVFAIKKNKDKLILCNAPFPNVFNHGGVCLGSAKVSKDYRTYESMMEYWDKLFFGSEFTHLNNTKIIQGNVNLLWKEAIETGKPFKNEVLIELKTKLEDLLK